MIGGDEETRKGNESMTTVSVSEGMPEIRNSVRNLNYDAVNTE